MRHITIIAAMMLAFTVSASAHKRCGEDWKERMMCERIAFLTTELNFTQEEAQAFWPVYNEISLERDAAMHKVFRTFKELDKALKEGKSEKEVEKLLENYLDALSGQRTTEEQAAIKFKEVLSVEKLAKLYIGEEKFRRQHIRRMKSPDGHKPGPKSEPKK